MSFLSVIIASAGMTLATGAAIAGPDGSCSLCASHGEAKSTEAPKCDGCAKMGEGEKCSMCASHDGAKDAMSDVKEDLPMIDASLYANADWPTHNSGEGLYAKDFQGKQLQVALGNETWISEKANVEGKVLVLDFWATWCPPCVAAMPILDKMQKAESQNLAIMSIGGQREDEATVRSYLSDHEESIHALFDADQSVFKPFQSEGIPLVVVISTDGVVRWIGNPHDPAFQPAVKKVIAVDPMIQAKS